MASRDRDDRDDDDTDKMRCPCVGTGAKRRGNGRCRVCGHGTHRPFMCRALTPRDGM